MTIPKPQWIVHSLWKIRLETELDRTVQVRRGLRTLGLVARHEKMIWSPRNWKKWEDIISLCGRDLHSSFAVHEVAGPQMRRLAGILWSQGTRNGILRRGSEGPMFRPCGHAGRPSSLAWARSTLQPSQWTSAICRSLIFLNYNPWVSGMIWKRKMVV